MEEVKTEVKKSTRPAKGSEEAKIWAKKMLEARQAKKALKPVEEKVEKKPKLTKVLKE